MRKFLILLVFFAFANADIGNQTSKNKSEQSTIRNSSQSSKQKSDTITKSKTKGNENSTSETISNTLSKITSFNHTVTTSNSGSWDIILNPIPHILSELRKIGWAREAFYLKNSDIGTSYFTDNNEEIIDMNAKAFYESKAQMKGGLDDGQIQKLQKYINILYYTATVISSTTKELQSYPNLKIEKFDDEMKKAIIKVYKAIKNYNQIYIYSCNFAGDINSYSCNNGKYTLVITNALPLLYINGASYYSATSVGFINPTLKISFATSTNDAFSKLAQNQDSRSVAGMIRDYTSKLVQQGHSDIATTIRNKFVEKSLNHGININATTTVQAINSGSPMAVLKLFQ